LGYDGIFVRDVLLGALGDADPMGLRFLPIWTIGGGCKRWNTSPLGMVRTQGFPLGISRPTPKLLLVEILDGFYA
jgi:hypothetical protein